MIRHHVALIAFLTVLTAPVLAAQEVPALSLDEALRMFATNNLELRIARSYVDQAEGLALQAGVFPNPSVGSTYEPLSGGTGSYSETYLTASQRVVVSGSRSARSEVGERRRDVAVFRVSADSLRLAFEVKAAYVRALRSQERRTVTERIAEIFREAARSATERHDAGDISLYALRRIQVERARYETRLADADMEVGSAQRILALLVTPSGYDSRVAAGPLPTDMPRVVPQGTLESAVVERRSELGAARADVAAEAAQARLIRAERVPDLTATAGFKRQSDGLRGAFLGLSLPLPLFDRGRGAVAAADAGLRAAEERLALTRHQLESEILQAIESYEIRLRRSDLLSAEGLGEVDDLLDIAMVAYEEGAMELVELLDAADAQHETQTAEAGLRAALWIAYFDLERALGGFEVPPLLEAGR